ncbi:MAG: hypothetical protein AAF846_00880 [Chloroflexota bacterium]
MKPSRITKIIMSITTGIMMLLLLMLATEYLYRANLDVAIFPDLGARILDGERPYIDFFEINLPTIMYLNIIPAFLSDLTGLNALLLVHILVWTLMLWASVSTFQIVTTHTNDSLQWLAYILPMTLVVIMLFAWFYNYYAQRELIFIAMIVPWIALRFLRWESQIKVSHGSYFVVGVIAAIGASIKPYYPLTIILIEGYGLLRQRNLRSFFTPEVYGFATFTVLYVLFFVFNFDIFRGLLDQLLLSTEGYHTYGQVSLWDFMRDKHFIFAGVLSLLPFTIWSIKHPLFHFSRIMGLVGFSGLIMLVLQAKGYGYHWLPMWFGAIGTITILFACIGNIQDNAPSFLCDLGTRLIFLPVIVLGAQGSTMMRNIELRGNPYLDIENAHATIYFTERYTDIGDEVFATASWIGTVSPYLEYLDRFNASSYTVSYPIKMAYADNYEDQFNPEYPIPDEVQDMLVVMRDDLAEQPPLIILDRAVYDFLDAQDVLLDDLILANYAQVGDWRGRGVNAFTPLNRTPETELSFQFGEHITLDRWLTVFPDGDQTVMACNAIDMRTIWRAQDNIFVRYSLSLTVADEQGNSIAQFDEQPSDTSTIDWRTDTYYQDDRQLMIPCDTPAGTYSLLLTMYDPLTDDSNLPVLASDGATYGAYVWFGSVTVIPAEDAN